MFLPRSGMRGVWGPVAPPLTPSLPRPVVGEPIERGGPSMRVLPWLVVGLALEACVPPAVAFRDGTAIAVCTAQQAAKGVEVYQRRAAVEHPTDADLAVEILGYIRTILGGRVHVGLCRHHADRDVHT